MDKGTDQQYLLSDQYKDASNVGDRFTLHDRFSTNTYGWHEWVFDHFNFEPKSHVLKLGCGPAYLWLKNIDRIPKGWNITLSDFSPGMLEEAQNNLRGAPQSFSFEVIDAQSIPFGSESFDGVIANHMLFHVPDRSKALSEIRRVLKCGGRLYASTVGQDHLREIGELRQRVEAKISKPVPSEFDLDNGLDQLSPWFFEVVLHRYEDSLMVTEADPLVAYVRSSIRVTQGKLQVLRNLIEEEITLRKALRITKQVGMYVGKKPDS